MDGPNRADLPADLRDPVIRKIELAGAPILTYTVASSRMDDEALSWFVDNQVSKSLLAVPGVGAVSRVGGVTREVRVDLDPLRLLAFNTTAADISRQLQQSQQEASGGRVDFAVSSNPYGPLQRWARRKRSRSWSFRWRMDVACDWIGWQPSLIRLQSRGLARC